MTWMGFDPISREKVVEMYKRLPVEISIRDLMRPMYYNCRPTDFSKVEVGLLSRRTGTLEAETSMNGKPFRSQQKRVISFLD